MKTARLRSALADIRGSVSYRVHLASIRMKSLCAPRGKKEDFNFDRLLSRLWDNYSTDDHPKDRRMRILRDKRVAGMGVENIRYLTNEMVRRVAQNGVYLEVGTYRGSSLLSAALFNDTTRCIGIDNFSQFNKREKNEYALKRNLAKFGRLRNIEFYNKDYREALRELFEREPHLKVNVYYYDGKHSYRDQLEGLEVMLPHYAERCIILVDDINWPDPERASEDFLRKNPSFRTLLKIKTSATPAPNWWNGFQVIARGI